MYPFDGMDDEEIEGTIGGHNPYVGDDGDDDDEFDPDDFDEDDDDFDE